MFAELDDNGIGLSSRIYLGFQRMGKGLTTDVLC